MRPIERDELEPLATGAWILGTGGGGSPYLSYLNMCNLYAAGSQVNLMDPADLATTIVKTGVLQRPHDPWTAIEHFARAHGTVPEQYAHHSPLCALLFR